MAGGLLRQGRGQLGSLLQSPASGKKDFMVFGGSWVVYDLANVEMACGATKGGHGRWAPVAKGPSLPLGEPTSSCWQHV